MQVDSRHFPLVGPILLFQWEPDSARSSLSLSGIRNYQSSRIRFNEITAMQSYRRLSELAGHPVLSYLLTGLIQEESIHSSFYWNVARVKLAEAKFSRDLARFIIGRFWRPVGQGKGGTGNPLRASHPVSRPQTA